MKLEGPHGALLVLRFLLELALLAAAAAACIALAEWPLNAVLAAVSVIVIAVVWGVFLSPRARVGLPGWAKVVLEAVLFGGAALGLFFSGWGAAALILFVAWAADRALLRVTAPAE